MHLQKRQAIVSDRSVKKIVDQTSKIQIVIYGRKCSYGGVSKFPLKLHMLVSYLTQLQWKEETLVRGILGKKVRVWGCALEDIKILATHFLFSLLSRYHEMSSSLSYMFLAMICYLTTGPKIMRPTNQGQNSWNHEWI